MTSPRRSSVQVLLAVRRRREEIEERRLADLMQQAQHAETDEQRIRAAVQGVVTKRREDVQVVRSCADHQYEEVIYRELMGERDRAAERVAQLNQLREKQLAAYCAAHCNREVISQLLDRRIAAYQSGIERTEQARLTDLATARTGLKRHTGEFSGPFVEEVCISIRSHSDPMPPKATG